MSIRYSTTNFFFIFFDFRGAARAISPVAALKIFLQNHFFLFPNFLRLGWSERAKFIVYST